jgi:hypothetical protein
MRKVVYSHWSKPSKDESLGFNSKQAFKNCAELSVFHSKKWFDKVELVTDEKGYKFLIEDLKLPFTDVKVELDCLNHISKINWSIGKIYACKIQDEPFMHQDFDVVWFKKPPLRILNAQAAFQNIELDEHFHPFYSPLMNDAKTKDYELNKYCDLDLLRAYNCGIIVFNDLSIINKWYDLAIDYVNKNKKNMPLKPIFFEQFLIYNLCKHYNFKVENLGDGWVKQEEAVKYGYTHLICDSKRKKYIEDLVEKKLRKLKLFYGLGAT